MTTNYQDYGNFLGRRSGSDRRVSAGPSYTGIEKRLIKDRRKETRERGDTRFRAQDVTFVKLSSAQEVDIGQLIDISKGGLALRCFLNEEKTSDYSDLGIFSSGGDFAIDKILFRIISDTELANNIPFSTIIFRRYSVQFEGLTPNQTTMLDYFLLNHTLLGQA